MKMKRFFTIFFVIVTLSLMSSKFNFVNTNKKNNKETLNNIKISNYELEDNLINFNLSFKLNYEVNLKTKSIINNDYYFSLKNNNDQKTINIYNIDSILSGSKYFVSNIINDKENQELDFLVEINGIPLYDDDNQIIDYDLLTFHYKMGEENKSLIMDKPIINFVEDGNINLENDNLRFSLQITENNFNVDDIHFYEYKNNNFIEYSYDLISVNGDVYTFEILNPLEISEHNIYVNLGYNFTGFLNVSTSLSILNYKYQSFKIFKNFAHDNNAKFSIELNEPTNLDMNNLEFYADIDMNHDGIVDSSQAKLDTTFLSKETDLLIYYFNIDTSQYLDNAYIKNFNCYYNNKWIFASNDILINNSVSEDNLNFQIEEIGTNNFKFSIESEYISDASLNNASLSATYENNKENLHLIYESGEIISLNNYRYYFNVDELISGKLYYDFVLSIPNINMDNINITDEFVATEPQTPNINNIEILETTIGKNGFVTKIEASSWEYFNPNNFDWNIINPDDATSINHVTHLIFSEDNNYYFETKLLDTNYWSSSIELNQMILNDDYLINLDESKNINLKDSKINYIEGSFEVVETNKKDISIDIGVEQEGSNLNDPSKTIFAANSDGDNVVLDSEFLGEEAPQSGQIDYHILNYDLVNLDPNKEYDNITFALGQQIYKSDEFITTQAIELSTPVLYLIYFFAGLLLLISLILFIILIKRQFNKPKKSETTN